MYEAEQISAAIQSSVIALGDKLAKSFKAPDRFWRGFGLGMLTAALVVIVAVFAGLHLGYLSVTLPPWAQAFDRPPESWTAQQRAVPLVILAVAFAFLVRWARKP